MTDIAIRFPQTQSSSTAFAVPSGWRLRGAAVAAAVVLGTAASTAAVRYADHGVAISPAVASSAAAATAATAATAFTATSIAPVSAGSFRVVTAA